MWKNMRFPWLLFLACFNAAQNNLNQQQLSWMSELTAFPSSGSCQGTYTLESTTTQAVIASTTSKANYTNNLSCSWKITAAQGYKIQVLLFM